jgi:PmbA protein
MAKDDLTELRDLAEGVVDRARKAGADVAEVGARKGYDLSVRVRLGATELVEEAGHRGISLRVIRSQRVAVTATSDLTPSGLERLVSDAIELAELSEASLSRARPVRRQHRRHRCCAQHRDGDRV